MLNSPVHPMHEHYFTYFQKEVSSRCPKQPSRPLPLNSTICSFFSKCLQSASFAQQIEGIQKNTSRGYELPKGIHLTANYPRKERFRHSGFKSPRIILGLHQAIGKSKLDAPQTARSATQDPCRPTLPITSQS